MKTEMCFVYYFSIFPNIFNSDPFFLRVAVEHDVYRQNILTYEFNSLASNRNIEHVYVFCLAFVL